MKHIVLICLMLNLNASVAQKDCNKNNPNYIPLTDLGTSTFKGYSGGLYPNGNNTPSGIYLQNIMNRANAIRPLDSNGNVYTNGKIVMIGVGASNPRTEFAAFQSMMDTFYNKNPRLITVNTCLGGQGVQKMNDPLDNYWKSADHMFDSMQLNAKQVQIAWIETENTQKGDTVFPAAPFSLIQDLKVLLQTLKQKYPNLKLCYLSARGYSGWALSGLGKGLEFPRDYFNGWACKWLIDSAANGNLGFVYEGNNADIPMPVYSTYMWTNKGDIRKDGFSIDCNTDIGADGLHLSATGEAKLGKLIFDFFLNDTSSKPWFLESHALSFETKNTFSNQILVYPNPAASICTVRFSNENYRTIRILNVLSQEIRTIESSEQTVVLPVSDLESGMYWIQCNEDGKNTYIKLIIERLP